MWGTGCGEKGWLVRERAHTPPRLQTKRTVVVLLAGVDHGGDGVHEEEALGDEPEDGHHLRLALLRLIRQALEVVTHEGRLEGLHLGVEERGKECGGGEEADQLWCRARSFSSHTPEREGRGWGGSGEARYVCNTCRLVHRHTRT